MKIQSRGMHALKKLSALVVLCLGMASVADAQVLFYNFNEAGVEATNSGSTGSADSLAIMNAEGVGQDLHGAGVGGGKALDLSSATGMGSMGSNLGPVAVSETAGNVFDGAQSFTISGWYNAAGDPLGSARVLETRNLVLLFNGALRLQVGGDTVSSDSKVRAPISSVSGSSPEFNCTNQWRFMAVTYVYRADKNESMVTFYAGDTDPASVLVSNTITYMPSMPILGKGGKVFVGNTKNGIRPFKGRLDNIAVFCGTDLTGALTPEAINALRLAQIKGN